MANGTVLVDRWHIRLMSALLSDTSEVNRGPRGVIVRRFVKENGGELAHAEWPGHSWQAPLGRLQARAVTADGEPAVGAVLWLKDTHYKPVADATGAFTVNRLVPGPYVMRVIDPRLEALKIDIPTKLAFNAERDSTHIVVVIVPTAEQFVHDRCTAARMHNSAAGVFVIGRVTTADGRPVARATVAFFARRERGAMQPLPDAMVTESDGIFQSCAYGSYLEGEALITVTRFGELLPSFRYQRRLQSRLSVVNAVLTEQARAAARSNAAPANTIGRK